MRRLQPTKPTRMLRLETSRLQTNSKPMSADMVVSEHRLVDSFPTSEWKLPLGLIRGEAGRGEMAILTTSKQADGYERYDEAAETRPPSMKP